MTDFVQPGEGTGTELTVEERLDRIEKAIRTLAWWLVEAQTGFADRDARGIERVLDEGEARKRP